MDLVMHYQNIRHIQQISEPERLHNHIPEE